MDFIKNGALRCKAEGRQPAAKLAFAPFFDLIQALLARAFSRWISISVYPARGGAAPCRAGRKPVSAHDYFNTSKPQKWRDGFHQKRRFALQSGRAPARGKTCFCPVFRFNTSLACKGIFAMYFIKNGALRRKAKGRQFAAKLAFAPFFDLIQALLARAFSRCISSKTALCGAKRKGASSRQNLLLPRFSI